MGFLLLIKTKILSFIIRNINGDVSDNTSKFYQINKIWRNIKLDQIPGDYIEFGIFKGKFQIPTAISCHWEKLQKGEAQVP